MLRVLQVTKFKMHKTCDPKVGLFIVIVWAALWLALLVAQQPIRRQLKTIAIYSQISEIPAFVLLKLFYL